MLFLPKMIHIHFIFLPSPFVPLTLSFICVPSTFVNINVYTYVCVHT